MKKSLIICFFLIFVGCSKNNANKVYRYHLIKNSSDIQDIDNKLIKYKCFFYKDKIEIRDSSNAVLGEYLYKITNEGIFIKVRTEYQLVYSFELGKNVKREIELQSLFLENAKLVESKKFFINNTKSTLYHFIEDTGDMIIDSYYLEGEGFIGGYEYNDVDFLYLKTPKALELSKDFLNDSTFFAKLVLEKIDKKVEDSLSN